MTWESSFSDTPRLGSDYTSPADLDTRLCELFWTRVERVLRDVVVADPGREEALDQALSKLDRLRKRVDVPRDPAFPAAIYNLDPLQIAIDLAGSGPPTAQQYQSYRTLVHELGEDEHPLGADRMSIGNVPAAAYARTVPDDVQPRLPDSA